MSAAASSTCLSSTPTRPRVRSPRCPERRDRERPRSGAEQAAAAVPQASPPPFALEGIDHVVLLVDDMERARAFYCDVIGCSVDRALPEHGMLQLRAGAALIDLVDIASREGADRKSGV